MSDDPNNYGVILGALAGAYAGLLQWLGFRHIKRIDSLEAEARKTITRTELNIHLDRIHSDMKEGFKDVRDDVKSVHSRIDLLKRNGNGYTERH